jgi:tetratricopeptide (TPR) repeat protein
MHPLVWLVTLVVLAILWREFWIHLVLPVVAMQFRARGSRQRAAAILERSAKAPSLLGQRAKRDVRYRLAWFLLEDGRPAEAAEQCRMILQGRLSPGVEANIRLRLADCLEAAGDPEAGAERERAQALVQGSAPDVETVLSRARILEGQHRYEEACAAYEEGLRLLPQWNDTARAEVLLRLALASYHAGRPVEAARRAEEAIELKPLDTMRTTAHSVAALGYSGQGNLEEAERHREEAFRLAESSGSAETSAHYLAQLAGTRMRRGSFVEAMQDCERAAGMSLKARRLARHTESDCLRIMGRFDAAREALQQARRAPGLAQPAGERRMQATLALAQTFLECEAGKVEAAGPFLEEARAEFASDPKLLLFCDANAAWVAALRGDEAAARRLIDDVEQRLAAYTADQSTQELGLAMLGWACFVLRDWPLARSFWERYLELDPSPAFQPQAWYHVGECAREMADPETARRAYQKAIEPNVDTRYARLARKRLDAMDGGT